MGFGIPWTGILTMWTVQFKDGMAWQDLQAHKFFLQAWLHMREIEKTANDVTVQIVRRFS